ncbi:MAG: sulfatase-like hydrolase/transferase [Burkholderiaceae bacterium]
MKSSTWIRRSLIALFVLAVLGGLLWSQRVYLMQHSVGWITDWRNPRAPNRPVPWQEANPTEGQPLAPDAGSQAASRSQVPPNIILIVADDLGINDVSMHRNGPQSGLIQTPGIDRLAAEGVRFDRGYAAAAVCTVSRAAILTGRYPWRFGVEFTPTPGALGRIADHLYPPSSRAHPVVIDRDKARAARPFNELGMPGSEITLAEVLRERGYHTVHIGKWHLGNTPEMRPNAQGFHETLFMESGLYLPHDDPRAVNLRAEHDPVDRFLWPNMRYAVSYNGSGWFEPVGYLTDYFTDEALRVIAANRGRPFFLYLAHWGVHTPLQASRADYDALAHIADHRERVYAAMIRSVDRSVARILQSLDQHGLADNTLVIFTSDNGAPGSLGLRDLNAPYRGWKLTHFEGGIRVPFAARWPRRIEAGSVQQVPASHIDLLPTVVAAAQAKLPGDRPIDGVDLLEPSRKDRRPLFWRDGAYRAVQSDGWKLIDSPMPKRQWLFHLAQDPTERNNLIQQEGAQRERLERLLSEHHAGLPTPLWPSFVAVPVPIDKTLDQPHAQDDEFTYWFN